MTYTNTDELDLVEPSEEDLEAIENGVDDVGAVPMIKKGTTVDLAEVRKYIEADDYWGPKYKEAKGEERVKIEKMVAPELYPALENPNNAASYTDSSTKAEHGDFSDPESLEEAEKELEADEIPDDLGDGDED